LDPRSTVPWHMQLRQRRLRSSAGERLIVHMEKTGSNRSNMGEGVEQRAIVDKVASRKRASQRERAAKPWKGLKV